MKLCPQTLPGPDFELHFQRLNVEQPELRREGELMLQLVQALQEAEGPDLLATTCAPAGLLLSPDALRRVRVTANAASDPSASSYRVEYSLRTPWTWAGASAKDTADAVRLIRKALDRAEPANALLERLAARRNDAPAGPRLPAEQSFSDDALSPLEVLWQERGASGCRRQGVLDDGTGVFILLSPVERRQITSERQAVTVRAWVGKERRVSSAFGIASITEPGAAGTDAEVWERVLGLLSALWSVRFEEQTVGVDARVQEEVRRLLENQCAPPMTDLSGFRTLELKVPVGSPGRARVDVRVREDRSARSNTFRWRVTVEAGADGDSTGAFHLTVDIHGCEDVARMVTACVACAV